MKRFSLFASLVLFILTMVMIPSVVLAAPNVTLNGEVMQFDVQPQIEDDRTLVPMRAIFERLGAEVRWDGELRAVYAKAGTTQIFLQIDKRLAQVNGQNVLLDVPPRLIGGRTLVPLRFVAETLGAEVGWDEVTKTISIKTEKALPPPPSVVPVPPPAIPAPNPAIPAPNPAIPAPPPDAIERPTTEDIVQKALPATVSIQVKNGVQTGIGSGFFLDNQGKIATNYHVVENATAIQIVTYDKKVHRVVRILTVDADLDIAILETEAQGYPVLPLGSTTELRAGQRVISIGNPFGLDWTVSEGIIANPDRYLTENGPRWIQHTAPISPGNSGGPLILEKTGEIIGINTQVVALQHSQNLNLAGTAANIAAVAARPPQAAPIPSPVPAKPNSEAGKYAVWVKEKMLPAMDVCFSLLEQVDGNWESWSIERLEAEEKNVQKARSCLLDVQSQVTGLRYQLPETLRPVQNEIEASIDGFLKALLKLEYAYSDAIWAQLYSQEDLRQSSLEKSRRNYAESSELGEAASEQLIKALKDLVVLVQQAELKPAPTPEPRPTPAPTPEPRPTPAQPAPPTNSLQAYLNWVDNSLMPKISTCTNMMPDNSHLQNKQFNEGLQRVKNAEVCSQELLSLVQSVSVPAELTEAHSYLLKAAQSNLEQLAAIRRTFEYALAGDVTSANLAIQNANVASQIAESYVRMWADAVTKARLTAHL